MVPGPPEVRAGPSLMPALAPALGAPGPSAPAAPAHTQPHPERGTHDPGLERLRAFMGSSGFCPTTGEDAHANGRGHKADCPRNPEPVARPALTLCSGLQASWAPGGGREATGPPVRLASPRVEARPGEASPEALPAHAAGKHVKPSGRLAESGTGSVATCTRENGVPVSPWGSESWSDPVYQKPASAQALKSLLS